MGNYCGCVKRGPLEAEVNIEAKEDRGYKMDRSKNQLESEFGIVVSLVPISFQPVKQKRASLSPFLFSTRREATASPTLTLKRDDRSIPGEVYYGFWDIVENMRAYKGIIIYSDGSIYEGHFFNGVPAGKGRKIYPELEVYEGDFENGLAHGKGRYTHPEGGYYEGDWVNNKQEGSGIEVWQDGQKYEGEYKNGLEHGKGRYQWEDGAEYVGEFKDGKQEGKGTYMWPNGRKYEGDWKGGKEHGWGILCYRDGIKYEGEFADALKEGKGTMYWPNGQICKGTWVKNKQEGEAIIIINGQELMADFSEGNMVSTPKPKNHGNGGEKGGVNNKMGKDNMLV